MPKPVLKLEAQKGTLCQLWKLKKDTLCQSWKLKKAPCPAAHPQYSQVWEYPPPPPVPPSPGNVIVLPPLDHASMSCLDYLRTYRDNLFVKL